MSARVIKRLLWAAAVLAACGLLVPTAALAHAVLQQTEPARGATAEQAPEQVRFRFSEAVEASFGAVRVFNADGERVDTGEAFRPGGRSSAIATRLKSGLPDGSYTATYRVISADSHPVSGGFVFSVGTPGAGPAQTVSDLVDQGNAGPVTEIAFGVVRFLDYAAIALAIGLLAFLAFVWRPALAAVAGGDATWRAASEVYVRRVRTIMVAALGAGLVSGALGIVLQGATAAGVSFWAALDRTIVGEVLDTRFGTVWGARLVAWAALGVALFALRRTVSVPALRPAQLGATGLALLAPARAWRVALVLIPLAFLAVSPALAGHASTQSPQLLLVPTDVIHVVAMSVWLAGLALIVFALPVATGRLESDDRSRLLAATLTRFSPIALAAVAALLTSGLVQSFVHVRSLDNVVGTAFGRAALIKLCLLLALIGLGAINRRRVIPRLRQIAAGGGPPAAAGRLLRRTVRAEVALIVVVLGVTAALVSYAPPTAVSSGPFSTSERLGPAQLELTVDPARVGSNEIHLYLFDAADGSQSTSTHELELQLYLPDKDIGPLSARPRKAGPGHYVVPAAAFGVAGSWQVKVTNRVSDFDEYATTIDVPIE